MVECQTGETASTGFQSFTMILIEKKKERKKCNPGTEFVMKIVGVEAEDVDRI